jgi:glutamate-1-semialdehyde 2,1-aminomutase
MATPARNAAELAIVQTAQRVLPGGGFGNMASDIVIREGRGGRVWDVSGNEYVDFLLGSGPMLIGHAHPDVNAAVSAQLARGTTYFANNEHGIQLAADIVDAVACAEQIRYVSTGSEADAYAMRLARAHRRREKILKFEGGFHGMSDYGLASWIPKQPGNYPQARADSAGIPAGARDGMLVAPFNDIDTTADIIREYADDIAGVIVEPFQRVIPPQPGFLQDLRELTAQHDIALIFDEIVTGFRFAYGGAQDYYGVVPDVCTLGKVIGGGFPLAAIAGGEEIMSHFDRNAVGDEGFMPNVGTLNGNPVAAVAGVATLAVLREPGTYERLFATGQKLMDGLSAALSDAGLAAQVIGVPPLFDVMFTDKPIRDYRDSLRHDAVMARRFTELLREHGVFKNESKIYVSTAHDDADVALAIDAFQAAAKALAAER